MMRGGMCVRMTRDVEVNKGVGTETGGDRGGSV